MLETYVYLTSQMGRSLSDPWSACVEVCGAHPTAAQQQLIEEIVERNLGNTTETSAKIVKGELNLF
jgi:S-adenosylmethionine synthetase